MFEIIYQRIRTKQPVPKILQIFIGHVTFQVTSCIIVTLLQLNDEIIVQLLVLRMPIFCNVLLFCTTTAHCLFLPHICYGFLWVQFLYSPHFRISNYHKNCLRMSKTSQITVELFLYNVVATHDCFLEESISTKAMLVLWSFRYER